MLEEPHLGIKRGILRHYDQVIDGVEPEPNGIKGFVYAERKWKSHCRILATKRHKKLKIRRAYLSFLCFFVA
jgi:hypothetical protein